MERKPNVKRLLISLPALLALFAAALLARAEKDDGWRSLFNGKDLTGWKMTGPGEFKVQDGELVTHGGMGLLWYEGEKFGDCEMRVVFTTERPADNSGVFIRIDGEPKDPWFAVHHGYEVQIDNQGDDWHRTGALYSISKVSGKVETKVGEPVELLITLDGDKTECAVNGTKVMTYTEGDPVPEKKKYYEPDRGPRPTKGYIGLQNHDQHSHVRFKSISVRPLK